MTGMGRRSGRGLSLTELIAFIAVLGIMLGAGSAIYVRQAAQAADLQAYAQAVLAAQQTLEVRRSSGRLPGPAELARLRSAIGAKREPTVDAREVPSQAAGLSQVTVTVSWRSGTQGATGRRQVRLTTLARTAR